MNKIASINHIHELKCYWDMKTRALVDIQVNQLQLLKINSER